MSGDSGPADQTPEETPPDDPMGAPAPSRDDTVPPTSGARPGQPRLPTDGPLRPKWTRHEDPPTDPDFRIPWLPPLPPAADREPPSRVPYRQSRPIVPVLRDRVRQYAARRRQLIVLAGRSLVAAVALTVFAATAAAWGAITWANKQFRQVSALEQESTAIRDAVGQRGDENFLLVGSDTRAGARPEDDIGTTELVTGARSDTVMIAHLPADRSRAVVVSFPRDLEIDRPTCERWDPVTGQYVGGFDFGAENVKINTAYQVGGPRCITRVVQQLSGLMMNHFVGVDFQGFKAMVEAVDGVLVCAERPLEDDELGVVIPVPGVHRIDGDTALRYVRARDVVGDPTGDYGRIIRQQRFLSALLRKTMSESVLFHPGRLRALVEAVAANTFGENVDVGTLLELARSLDGLDPADVTFVTVPTTGETNGRGNEELREADTAALFRAIIDGTPLPGEAPGRPPPAGPAPVPAAGPSSGYANGPQPLPAPPLLAPQQVLVRVLNGGETAGLAANTARALTGLGFGVVEVGNAAQQLNRTVVMYPPGREAAARTVAAALPTAALQPDATLAGAVVVVLGLDHNGTVVAPPGLPPPPLPPDLSTVNAADATCD